jgi:DNA-binding winged helix-turn-helix (wHTH) protein/Tol biopolymer transport system component
MSEQNGQFFEFDGYRIEPAERLLRRDNAVVQLPPKAIDLLLALLEQPGHVVSKKDLMQQVWPDTVVEEANLSHNIFLLRKALGENARFIETIPKRGYRFIGEVSGPSEDGRFRQQTITRVSIEEEFEGTREELDGFSFAAQSEHSYPNDTKTTVLAEKQTSNISRALMVSFGLMTVCIAVAAGFYFSRSSVANKRGGGPEFSRVTNSGKVAASSISPDGKFIAYVQNYLSGEGMVYVRQTDTNREIKLIDPIEAVFSGTAFSPDSRFVYYAAIDKREPNGALYRSPVLGGVSTRLAQNFGSMFTISPDGRQAAFYRKNESRTAESLMIVDLEGSGTEREVFTRLIAEIDMCGSPAWSPDGKTLAFAADAERRPDKPGTEAKIFTVDIETGVREKLSDEFWTEIGRMTWLPDGRGILFVGKRPNLGIQLYSFDPKTGATAQLTRGLQGYGNYGLGVTSDLGTVVLDSFEVRSQVWKTTANGDSAATEKISSGESDGRYGIVHTADSRIAFITRVGANFDIWTVKADGSDAKPITGDGHSYSDLTATLDGRYLVFAADRGSGTHIFRSNSDGTDLRQLTFGETSDSAPAIAPNSQWLVYAAWFNDRTTLKRISIDGGEPISLTDYDSMAPAVSPGWRARIIYHSGYAQGRNIDHRGDLF